jgi:protein involved in polysaccharide export with SLBB domain
MKSTRRLILAGALLLVAAASFGQAVTGAAASPVDLAAEAEQRVRIAIASELYPVTPGDVYQLSYRQTDPVIETPVLVDGDYSVNLGVFGKVDATGMRYTELKRSVERQIQSGYPRSMPSLSITSIGMFQVLVRGETPRARYVTVWGMSRLSEVVEGALSERSSLRMVTVIPRSGLGQSYDLYLAMREGKVEEDPMVKPGDTVVIGRSARKVTIEGEVNVPGTYELMVDEQLGTLVTRYAGGTTPRADTARVRVEFTTGEQVRVEYLDLAAAGAANTPLGDGDTVTVAAKIARRSIAFFEGAIVAAAPAAGAEVGAAAEPAAAYNRIIYPFHEGETVSFALRSIRESLSPFADLSAGFIVHEGSTAPVSLDMRAFLADVPGAADLPLEPNDRIVIPMLDFSVYVTGDVDAPGAYPFAPGRTIQQYLDLAGGVTQNGSGIVTLFDPSGEPRDPGDAISARDRIHVTAATVSVQGAVYSPGSFPFRAGASAGYYLGLAGGIDPERNRNQAYTVYDDQGRRRDPDHALQAGDRLNVPANRLLYNLNRYAPTIGTIVTAIWTGLLIVEALTPP